MRASDSTDTSESKAQSKLKISQSWEFKMAVEAELTPLMDATNLQEHTE